MAKKMIKTKEFGKRFVPSLISTATVSGGFIGTEILLNKTLKSEKLKRLKGPLAFLAGTALVALADEKDGKIVADLGRGMATAGARYTVDALVPAETKSKMGISSLGSIDETDPDQRERMLNDIAQQVKAEIEEMQGIYNRNVIPGDAGNPANPAGTTPPEGRQPIDRGDRPPAAEPVERGIGAIDEYESLTDVL